MVSIAAESGNWRWGFCGKEEAVYGGTDRKDSETAGSRGAGTVSIPNVRHHWGCGLSESKFPKLLIIAGNEWKQCNRKKDVICLRIMGGISKPSLHTGTCPTFSRTGILRPEESGSNIAPGAHTPMVLTGCQSNCRKCLAIFSRPAWRVPDLTGTGWQRPRPGSRPCAPAPPPRLGGDGPSSGRATPLPARPGVFPWPAHTVHRHPMLSISI